MNYIEINVCGLGVILFLIVMIFVGWIIKGIIGCSMISWVEGLVLCMLVVWLIYNGVK